MQIRTIIAVAALVLGGCQQSTHTNFRYAKQPFTMQQPTHLRCDGVYIKQKDNGYSYYRFFNNGRCFAGSWREGSPSDSILRSTHIQDGQRTFYRNTGDDVRIETWEGYYTSYVVGFAVVDSAGLTKTAYKLRGFSTSKMTYAGGIRYEFRHMDSLSNADW